MKNILFTLIALFSFSIFAQSGKGSVSGTVRNKGVDLDPLPFVSIYLKEKKSVGTTSDFDGNYQLKLPVGVHIVVFDFVGYKSVKKQVTVVADTNQIIPISMEALTDALDAVVLRVVRNKENEEALLAQRKEKVEIVESIGAEQLTKIGVSNAATATTKIVGVQKNESSGEVFIRGLGDRYLSTTMNGLPIPSDDIEKKNIDLNLIPTNLIQNVSITKTYQSSSYADQASGSVNVSSKVFSKKSKGLKLGLGLGFNSNVIGQYNDFRLAKNANDVNLLGIYSNPNSSLPVSVTEDVWGAKSYTMPVNQSFSALYGGKIDFLGASSLNIIASLSNNKSFKYFKAINKQYNANELDNAYTDNEQFSYNAVTTALLDLDFKINSNHKIRLANVLINKMSDNLYEQGRNGKGLKIDNQPESLVGNFVRDQNLKQTTIIINQLLGDHSLSNNNNLKWAVGINNVAANEPNRIRNEFVIGDGTVLTDFTPVGVVAPSSNNAFQNRKSSQEITDFEINGFINDTQTFLDSNSKKIFELKGGVDFRNRTRDFKSLAIGVKTNGETINSIDNVASLFNAGNFKNGLLSTDLTSFPDTYSAQLTYLGAYLMANKKINNTTIDAGLRFEADVIELPNWDVANYINPVTFQSRIGKSKNEYVNFLPHLNLKQELDDSHSLRLSLSKTTTLPEFKELAPFQYVSPTNRKTVGNPNLEPSTNYNIDFKWEFFPTKSNLISLTTFVKQVLNPINLTTQTGAAGNFTYENTGEKASVYGLEAETRLNVLNTDRETIRFNFNATLMRHSQDLLSKFQYNGITETKLTGASEYIVNSIINYATKSEYPFNASLSGNYSSDKIFALGAPRTQNASDKLRFYNDQIIEKAFVTLDLAVSKKVNKHLSFRGSLKNILNPKIKQTQNIKDLTTSKVSEQIVSSYKRGVNFGISANYSF